MAPTGHSRYELARIAARLDAGGPDAPGDLAWLEESFREPASFWAALWAQQGALGLPPLRSRPGQGHDLYHDLIVRHVPAGNTAFVWHDRSRGLLSLSFADVHARSAQRMAAWAAAGVSPGASLCILLPVGPDYVISWLTGLRMGLRVSPLSPRGDRYVARRLEKLRPHHIVADPGRRRRLGPFQAALLPTDPAGAAGTPPAPALGSHTFAPDEPCAALFSDLSEPTDEPLPLSAEAAHLSALRDGLLALSLRPGDRLATPDLPSEKHQPCLLAAALMAGAAFVHLPAEELLRDPTILRRLPLRSLGVGPALRDGLARAGFDLGGAVGHWFKDPEAPYDAEAWRAFVARCGLSDVPASNLLVEAAAGGATLFSRRRRGGVGLEVLPAAGVPWRLVDIGAAGQEAAGQSGLFSQAPPWKPAPAARFVVARHGDGLLYAGTAAPSRAGRVIPREELISAIADLPFVKDASVVVLPAGGAGGQALAVLVVLTGAEPPAAFEAAREARIEALLGAVRERLGDDMLPDRVAVFPLYARRVEGRIDDALVARQYTSGALARKAAEPMFQCLTALRGRLLERSAAGASGRGT